MTHSYSSSTSVIKNIIKTYTKKIVTHLPNASKIVFASKICCCTHVDTSHVTEHKY